MLIANTAAIDRHVYIIFTTGAKFFNTRTLSIVRLLPDEPAAGPGYRGGSSTGSTVLPAAVCPPNGSAAAVRAL